MHVATGHHLSGLLLGGGSCRCGFLAVLELCCLWPRSLLCLGSGCHPKSLLGCGCPLPPQGKVEELLGTNMVLPFPNSLCIPLLPLLQPSAAFSLLISAVSSPQTNTRPLCTAIRDHLDVLCVCLETVMRRVKFQDGDFWLSRDRNGVLTMTVLAHFGWHPIWTVYILMLLSEKTQYFFSPAWANIGETAALLCNMDQRLSNVLKNLTLCMLSLTHTFAMKAKEILVAIKMS